MSDYKIIPKAPDYKINKEGEVLRSNDTKVFVLAGRKALLRKPDGTMEQFSIDDLVNELFNDEAEVETKVHNSDFHPSPESEIVSEENNTNESEDSELSKDEPTKLVSGEFVPSEMIIPHSSYANTSNIQQTNTRPRPQVANETEVKRGRGRPKKIKDTNEPVKVKGKRGRPAKPKNPNAPIKVKGKRGRPKGSKNKKGKK